MSNSSTAAAPRRGRRRTIVHASRAKPSTTASSHPPSITAVQAGQSYTRKQFFAATGIGAKAFRKAMVDGLPVKLIGKKYYVLGSDWLAFLANCPAVKPAAKAARTN